MPDPTAIFANRLRQARELRGLSQAELAKRSDLQPAAVSHFETGARRPSFDNLRRLADALAVSTDFLLGRSESIGGAATTDILYRDIGKLSADDQEVAKAMVATLAARNKGGNGGDKGT